MKPKKRKKLKSRSEIMAAVRSHDTKPEKSVRSIVHRLGFRFRLNNSQLPGSPDLVFPIRNRVIFVHGCFWHGHFCRRGNRIPVANREYWLGKIAGNRKRDKRVRRQLRRMGWNVLTIWECQLKKPNQAAQRLRKFFKAK